MTQIDSTKLKEIFQEAIEKDADFMKELLTHILQSLMETERDEQIGVEHHVRDNKRRVGTRNGYKDRSLNTRVGSLKLKKPQIREFPFVTNMFESYQRSEKAFVRNSLLNSNQISYPPFQISREKEVNYIYNNEMNKGFLKRFLIKNNVSFLLAFKEDKQKFDLVKFLEYCCKDRWLNDKYLLIYKVKL